MYKKLYKNSRIMYDDAVAECSVCLESIGVEPPDK